MSEGTAREIAVGIAAEALYYDIGDAYETEKTWGDLGRHVRAPYLDTVETIFKRLAERGYTITEAGALAPAGLTQAAEAIKAVCEFTENRLDFALDDDYGGYADDAELRGHIATLRALVAPAADAAGEPS